MRLVTPSLLPTSQTKNSSKGLSGNGTPTSGDLQFTTINDSTFVCNRKKTVEMHPTSAHKTAENPHTYVAFVEVKQVVNGRQYALNVHDPSSSATTSISTATLLTTAPTGEGYSTFSGDKGHCPHTGTNIFVVNVGTKKNLIFRLTVTGQQGPVPGSMTNPNASDYTCSYSNVLTCFMGEGWVTGDTVSVTLAKTIPSP